MPEELQGTGTDEGQPVDAGTGTGEGQPTETEAQTTQGGPDAEETFFDPQALDPALVPAYKQMQRAFGQKMEAIKSQREKIEAYDSFAKDPVTALQNMAKQYGYKLSRAEAEAMSQQNEAWQPNTWDEVMARAKEEVMRELNPVLGDIQSVKKQTIEKTLDDNCPDWRQYEDEMVQILQTHPTLAKDPVKLYRMALPPEVLESRAYQAALKKQQGKLGAKAGGTSTTKPSGPETPTGPVSFQEAVAYAKAKLAEQGIHRPT